MPGFWFTAMVAGLVAAGVVAQLGWQLPPKAEVKRLLRLDRLRPDRQPTHLPTSAGVVEP
ncbi:hypothetical protein [Mycolicibacterium tusciae]|jgi:hypothetical protein|uniref:hypothetical protein n=1 Tax=Mycolicibacterium tusciae TaxID=75922 RepID=UPI0013FE1635|nr:hypothetical protein [Mycolicibacterium tusciae]